MENNQNLQKLPTSNLILYITFPSQYGFIKLGEVEDTLFSRLNKSYRLSSSESHRFITREQQIISKKGPDIREYAFDSTLTTEELLTLFYSYIKEIYYFDVYGKTDYSTFTMSEIFKYHDLFRLLQNLYKQRLNAYKREIKRIRKAQKNLNGTPTFEGLNLAREYYEFVHVLVPEDITAMLKNEMIKKNMLSETQDLLADIGISNTFKMLAIITKEILLLSEKNLQLQRDLIPYEAIEKKLSESHPIPHFHL